MQQAGRKVEDVLRDNPLNLTHFREDLLILATGKSLARLYRGAGRPMTGKDIEHEARLGGASTAYLATANNQFIMECSKLIALERQYAQGLRHLLAQKEETVMEALSREKAARREDFDAVETELRAEIKQSEQRMEVLSELLTAAVTDNPDNYKQEFEAHFKQDVATIKSNFITSALKEFTEQRDDIVNDIKEILTGIIDAGEDAVETVQQFAEKLLDSAEELVEKAAEATASLIENVPKAESIAQKSREAAGLSDPSLGQAIDEVQDAQIIKRRALGLEFVQRQAVVEAVAGAAEEAGLDLSGKQMDVATKLNERLFGKHAAAIQDDVTMVLAAHQVEQHSVRSVRENHGVFDGYEGACVFSAPGSVPDSAKPSQTPSNKKTDQATEEQGVKVDSSDKHTQTPDDPPPPQSSGPSGP